MRSKFHAKIVKDMIPIKINSWKTWNYLMLKSVWVYKKNYNKKNKKSVKECVSCISFKGFTRLSCSLIGFFSFWLAFLTRNCCTRNCCMFVLFIHRDLELISSHIRYCIIDGNLVWLARKALSYRVMHVTCQKWF